MADTVGAALGALAGSVAGGLGLAVLAAAGGALVGEPASQSAVYLAASPEHDGMLLPHEIAEGQLANALVFLSACETGLGRPTADGVIGLGRAFLEAGALAVILSLWRVVDVAAVEVAGHFYRAALGIGQPAADAATALQLAMLATRASLREGRIRTVDGRSSTIIRLTGPPLPWSAAPLPNNWFHGRCRTPPSRAGPPANSSVSSSASAKARVAATFGKWR
jgi:CHAT domain-containing protein